MMMKPSALVCGAYAAVSDAVKALQQTLASRGAPGTSRAPPGTKLWDAFRKPIDDAFNRKTQEREKPKAH